MYFAYIVRYEMITIIIIINIITNEATKTLTENLMLFPFFFSFLKTYLFCFKVKITEREVGRDRKSIHLLVLSSNSHYSQSWVGLKQDARRLFMVFHMGSRSQRLEPPLSPLWLIGTMNGSGAASTKIGIYVGCRPPCQAYYILLFN